jgi:hypothetical protein
LAFNALMLLGTWALVEGVSFVATAMLLGPPAQMAEQRRITSRLEPFQPGGYFVAPTVIHPYVGAVLEPKDDGGKLSIAGKYRITEYGFVDDGPPIHKRAPDRVIVCILGGSVARQFSMFASDALAEDLAGSPEFAGRTFQFVRLASDGYKQPQQLMTLNYMLTLGAEFDIVINLDGFNEAALPGIDNIPNGVFSAYPRDWVKMVAGSAGPEFARRGGYVSYLRQQQRDSAQWFGSFPLRYSPTALMIWGILKNRSDRAISRQLEEMSAFSQKERTFCGSGPPETFDSPSAMYEHCTRLWSRSSILLHQVCAARGIRYYHFLQPNQYLPGSKPIGPQEAADAVKEGSPMCEAVRACFPLMQAQAPRLAEAGVAFTDLTGVFADHPEPIYKDVCCHVVTAGDLIMAKAIAARIKQPEPQPRL